MINFEEKNEQNIKNMLQASCQYWVKEAPEPNSELHKELINIFKFKQKAVVNETFSWLKSNYAYNSFPKAFKWKEALQNAEISINNNPALINYKANKNEEYFNNHVKNLLISQEWQEWLTKLNNKFMNHKFYFAFESVKPLSIDPLVFLVKNRFCEELIFQEFLKGKNVFIAVKDKGSIILRNCKENSINHFSVGDILKKYAKYETERIVQQNFN